MPFWVPLFCTLFLFHLSHLPCSGLRSSAFLARRNNGDQHRQCKIRDKHHCLSASLPSSSSSSSSSLQLPIKEEDQARVIVVGAGVGGMAIASRIASHESSPQVIVLEKNAFFGGRCGSFQVTTEKQGRFRHERGPSLLLLKDTYEELFQDCAGKTAADYGLEMVQCLPAYQVVFDDGDRIHLGFPTDITSSSSELLDLEKKSRAQMDSYEYNGSQKWDEYMAATAAFLDCGLPNFIEERFDLLSFPNFLYHALRNGGQSWPLKPHSDVLDATFSSSKMKALASFQNLYVGLEPYRNDQDWLGGILRKTAPAVFGLLAAIELHPNNKKAGVFAPVGGFQAVTNALERLAYDQGVLLMNETVAINVDADGVLVRASTGVKKHLPADLVIVNADLPYSTKSLLGTSDNKDMESETFDWDDKFDFSSGVIAFHWSIDKELSSLNTHNVFLAGTTPSEAEHSWRLLRPPGETASANDTKKMEPFNFYVHRASKSDPSASPKGCDSIMVLVPCETLKRDKALSTLSRSDAIREYKKQFDSERINMARDAVLRRLAVIPSLEDLRSHIVDETIDTPGAYAELYNVGAGTPFALSHGLGQLNLMRPSATCSTHENVLFTGASSRPGNGVPLVLIGAKLVAKKAMQKLRQLQGV